MNNGISLIGVDKNLLLKQEKEIERLTNELESANESIIWWQNRFNAVERDNERLNNIINELEKILITEISEAGFHYEKIKEDTLQWIFNELQELKESDK